MKRALLVAFGFLLLPGHPLAVLSGVPMGPVGLSVAVLGSCVAFGFWPPASAWLGRVARLGCLVLLVLAGARVALWWVAPAYGLPAWYYANGRFQGAVERSSDFRFESATRRDRELDFGGDEFPVHFLNDAQRFNFFGSESERRRSLPFSVRWEGWVQAPERGTYQFWLTASGPAVLWIDGKRTVDVDADGRETRAASVDLEAGSHTFRVSYARRPPRSGDLRVEWDGSGERRTLAVPYLLAAPVELGGWAWDRWLSSVARAVDVAYLAVLGIGALGLVAGRARTVLNEASGRWALLERPLLAAFLIAIYLHAALPELDRVDKFTLLGGGQDWLTHETLARDILLNGPLMTLGKPLGEGRTYYAQPFYPYALAAAHWLVGEDQFGPTVLQLFGLGVAGVLLYALARRLFGTPAALGTLLVFVGLRHWQLDWVARKLLSENVYFVVLPALLFLLIRSVDTRRRRDLLGAGLLLGLAVVTRGPTLLYVPLAAGLLAVNLRREGVGRREVSVAVATLLVVALGVAALVPIRNVVVAGEPAIVASSGGVNLEKFHRPTSRVRLAEAGRRWYAAYVQDIPTREVIEFVIQDPVGYAATYPPLALYTLGYGAAIDESHVVIWPDLVLLNVAYLGAILVSRRARGRRALFLHAFIAVHFATMLVFAPYDYDNRLVLPMYLPMAVFGGHALSQVAIGAARAASAARARVLPVGVGGPEPASAGSAGIIRRP